MKPADRKLLNKLRAESRQGQAEAVEHRQDLRLRARISQEIGAMLRELGVDPAQTRLAEFGGGAAAELAAIPDTPELQRADEAFEAAQPDDDEEEDPRHVLAGELDRIARSYADASEPEFANASPAALYAWCRYRLAARAEAAAGRTSSPSMPGEGGVEAQPPETGL